MFVIKSIFHDDKPVHYSNSASTSIEFSTYCGTNYPKSSYMKLTNRKKGYLEKLCPKCKVKYEERKSRNKYKRLYSKDAKITVEDTRINIKDLLKQNRQFDCEEYERCLDQAIFLKKEQWNCCHCENHSQKGQTD